MKIKPYLVYISNHKLISTFKGADDYDIDRSSTCAIDENINSLVLVIVTCRGACAVATR